MENLPSILTPDLGLLFWMLLAFLVVFVVLVKYGFPVIIRMVEDRKTYIDESLRKAHEASERLENIKQESEQILQDAREKQNAIRDIRTQVAELSVQIAEKVMRENLASDAQQMSLVNRFLDDAFSVNPN